MGSHTSRFEWIYFHLQYEIFLVLHNWGLMFAAQIYHFLSIFCRLPTDVLCHLGERQMGSKSGRFVQIYFEFRFCNITGHFKNRGC